MADISESDKLGMAALAASIASRPKAAKPKPRKVKAAPPPMREITAKDVDSGIVSIGDANDEAGIKAMQGYKNGGMIDRAAIRGKTKGKIC
jgi:hypothetical protein